MVDSVLLLVDARRSAPQTHVLQRRGAPPGCCRDQQVDRGDRAQRVLDDIYELFMDLRQRPQIEFPMSHQRQGPAPDAR